MGPVGNPLLWGKGGGSYSSADASNEMAATTTGHIPTVMAGVVLVGGLVLVLLDKGGFAFSGSGRIGRG